MMAAIAVTLSLLRSRALVFMCIAATLMTLVVPIAEGENGESEQECNGYRFANPFTPGDSCEDIYNENIQSRNKPGYYWILDGPTLVYCGMNNTGSSCEDIFINNVLTRDKSGYYRINIHDTWVYCDMTAVANAFSRCNQLSGADGIWKRIAGFNITAGDDCPSPWVKDSYNDRVSYCRPANDSRGCYSVNYSTKKMDYQRVCGRASGYQKGSTDGFRQFISMRNIDDIDSYYVDGLSITHGSPRNHIWTYGVGATEFNKNSNSLPSNCPCAPAKGTDTPDFVGSNYYCESGAGSSFNSRTYYLDDVLWDGAGCSASGDTCCSNPNLPWFYRQLNETTQDDIEVRICIDEEFNNEAVLITDLELYIQ